MKGKYMLPLTETTFKKLVEQKDKNIKYTHCKNCSMSFSDECNRETLEWSRAVTKGTCGKCYEEIIDHLCGDTSV
jgi:hypothetical protein